MNGSGSKKKPSQAPGQQTLFTFWKNTDTKKITSVLPPTPNNNCNNEPNSKKMDEEIVLQKVPTQDKKVENPNLTTLAQNGQSIAANLKRSKPDSELASRKASSDAEKILPRKRQTKKIKMDLSDSDSSDDEDFSGGRSSDDDRSGGSGGSDSSDDENHFGSPSPAKKKSGGLRKVGAAKQPAKSLSKSATVNNSSVGGDSSAGESDDEGFGYNSKPAKRGPARGPKKGKAGKTNGDKLLGDAVMKVEKQAPRQLPSSNKPINDIGDGAIGQTVTKAQPKSESFDYNNFTDTTPTWARPENIKDINGNLPGSPKYDHTTLFIPQEAWKNFTPAMNQYWKVKQVNQDKFLMFKLGKFYEIFYEDAIIAAKLLDLNFMGTKLHAGFPEKALDKFASILVENNYKVAVVEQIETARELANRLKGGRVHKNDKCITRELVGCYTRGTYCDPTKESYEPRYLWVLKPFKGGIAFCSSEIFLGTIECGIIPEDNGYCH